MSGPNIRTYDKKLWKKCIKCRNWKPREDMVLEDGTERKHGFGSHNSSDGLQSICFSCKNIANKDNRNRNAVVRVRHHTATRGLTQLGSLAPEGFTANLEEYLGYKIRALVKYLSQDLKDREGPTRKLRDALNEGYHIDHIRPLSSFNVIRGDKVDWKEFRKCWDMDNLSAIPAAENLAKGAKRDEPSSTQTKEEEGEAQEADVTIVRAIDITTGSTPDAGLVDHD